MLKIETRRMAERNGDFLNWTEISKMKDAGKPLTAVEKFILSLTVWKTCWVITF